MQLQSDPRPLYPDSVDSSGNAFIPQTPAVALWVTHDSTVAAFVVVPGDWEETTHP